MTLNTLNAKLNIPSPVKGEGDRRGMRVLLQRRLNLINNFFMIFMT